MRLEVADFGLGELDRSGLQLLTYLNTDRCCAKELLMTPGQTCPEHRHPPVGGQPGKEETFRCRWGTVILYVSGEPAASPRCRPPAGSEEYYTVWRSPSAAGRAAYDSARYETLVPGRTRRMRGIRVFHPQLRRNRHLYGSPHCSRAASGRGAGSRFVGLRPGTTGPPTPSPPISGIVRQFKVSYPYSYYFFSESSEAAGQLSPGVAKACSAKGRPGVLKLLFLPLRPESGEIAAEQCHLSAAMLQQIRFAGLCESDALAVGNHLHGCAQCRDRFREIPGMRQVEGTDVPRKLFVIR